MAGSEGEGGLMKGRVPQGDTHSATQLPLLLSEAAAPSALRWYLRLYWDLESQQQNSASPTRGRMRRVLTPQPVEFNQKSRKKYSWKKKVTQTVSVSVKVWRGGHSSVDTCFFERKLLALDISLQKKAVTFIFFPFSRLIRVAPVSDRRPGTLVSWLNTAKEGGGSPCHGLQSSDGFCETETIMSAITFYRENPPNGLMPIKSLFFHWSGHYQIWPSNYFPHFLPDSVTPQGPVPQHREKKEWVMVLPSKVQKIKRQFIFHYYPLIYSSLTFQQNWVSLFLHKMKDKLTVLILLYYYYFILIIVLE